MNRFLLYAVIFVVKILEVSIATTRIVLITKGIKKLGAIIGFFEVLIWISLTATVLTGITEDPLKALVYALGFSFGNYFGSTLESLIGIGTSRIEIILSDENDTKVIDFLRQSGYGLTILEGHGMNEYHPVIIMNVNRKDTNKVVRSLQELTQNIMITVNDIKPVYGGYGLKK